MGLAVVVGLDIEGRSGEGEMVGRREGRDVNVLYRRFSYGISEARN